MNKTFTKKELHKYYNNPDSYKWTNKSLRGEFEPYDKARLAVVNDLLTTLNLRNKKVLDIGCGSGAFTKLASIHKTSVTGIDISKKAISRLKSEAGNNEKYKLGSAESLPFKDNLFDLVMCFETLEHLKKPDTALIEINRVLKPKGLLLISVPNWFNFDRLSNLPILSKLRSLVVSKAGFYSHLHFHSPKEWERKFKSEGFQKIYSRPVYIFPPIPTIPKLVSLPKAIERAIFRKKPIFDLQQKIEKNIANVWPFNDLGQSHLWILKANNS